MPSQIIPEFYRGQTYYGPTVTIDTANYGASIQLEGVKKTFCDVTPGSFQPTSSSEVEALCVRNVSGITLTPGMVVTFQAAFHKRRVDGYSRITAQVCAGIVDDRLPAAGVRNGDLFWLMRKGHSRYRTLVAGDTIGIGDNLYAQTAANSTATSAAAENGHLICSTSLATFGATAATDGSMVRMYSNRLGTALEAATSGETNTLKGIDLMLV